MAIKFLDSISIGTSTISSTTSNLYLLNLTRTTTSLTTVGSVGIGTTTPAKKLDVNGDITFGTGNKFQTVTNALEGVGANGVYLRSAISSAASPSFSNSDDTNTGMFLPGSDVLGLSTAGSERFRITSAGNVGIGTATPAAKLHIRDQSQSISYMKMSAASSDANYGFFKFQDNTVNTGRLIIGATYGYGVEKTGLTVYNGNVGLGTLSPTAKLHVFSGVLKVEGTGCGIQMPDTSGNPLLALTTDQNTFAGCNIVNGWGNSSNTGVGVGTTRSDGTAFQVRTGVTLSSGIATSSGTQRLVVYGNGGTKITKSLGVGANASTTTGRIDASNDVVAFSTSDIRLKNNIKSIDKALDKVNSIQGIEFDWIEKEEVHGNSGRDIGVIAQEIEKILPDVVTTRDNGYKAVKYEKIVPLLIEAIKDLSKQVDGLKRLI